MPKITTATSLRPTPPHPASHLKIMTRCRQEVCTCNECILAMELHRDVNVAIKKMVDHSNMLKNSTYLVRHLENNGLSLAPLVEKIRRLPARVGPQTPINSPSVKLMTPKAPRKGKRRPRVAYDGAQPLWTSSLDSPYETSEDDDVSETETLTQQLILNIPYVDDEADAVIWSASASPVPKKARNSVNGSTTNSSEGAFDE